MTRSDKLKDQISIDNLVRTIKTKKILSDYDLGVQATLQWLKGAANPYDGRAK